MAAALTVRVALMRRQGKKESEEETDGEISKGIGNVGGRQEVYKHSELY